MLFNAVFSNNDTNAGLQELLVGLQVIYINEITNSNLKEKRQKAI